MFYEKTVKCTGKLYILPNTIICYPYRLTLGYNVFINRGVYITAREKITIGDNVDIAQDVNIWTEQHNYNSPDFKAELAPVVIKDYVWIASRATILPGIELGEGCVVACGSVVTKNVPPYTLVAGVPAKVIGQRNKNLKYKLGSRVWFA